MPFETVNIRAAGNSAQIVPARGAIISGLQVGGKDVLYLDRATLEDPSKNVRGGIPVLFPYAGKLENEIFLRANTKMKQHGFGRNLPWQITEKREDLLRLTLAPNAETRLQYPYEFIAEQSAQILPRGLQVELQITNLGNIPLPVSPGWHPYFVCVGPEKNRVRGDVPNLGNDRFSNDVEFDFGVVSPANGRANFEVPGLGKLALSFSPDLRHLQFWSQPGKDFICIEPFRGPNNTVNTPKRVDILAGEARTFWMRIEIE